jgi:threonine dehydratase
VSGGRRRPARTLPRIAARSHIGQRVRRAYRFTIGEWAGSLVEILEQLGDGCNIVDFQYGKTDPHTAHPVIAFEASEAGLKQLGSRIAGLGLEAEDVTGARSVEFRAIPVRPDLFSLPEFRTIAFPDRAGALREFMRSVCDVTSICYFNFTSTGETRGRALMGFEFASAADRVRFDRLLADSGLPAERLGADAWPCPVHASRS